MTSNLHVYSLNDEDFVVAEGVEGAWQVVLDMWGGQKSDYNDDGNYDFELVPDDKEISIFIEDEEELTFYQLSKTGVETKTAGEWAKVVGEENYLCGSNW